MTRPREVVSNQSLSKPESGSAHCGAMGLGAPLQHQDAGSNLSPAQWVKGPGCCRSGRLGLTCGPDLIPSPEAPYPGVAQRETETKPNKKTDTDTKLLIKQLIWISLVSFLFLGVKFVNLELCGGTTTSRV